MTRVILGLNINYRSPLNKNNKYIYMHGTGSCGNGSSLFLMLLQSADWGITTGAADTAEAQAFTKTATKASGTALVHFQQQR